MGWIDLSAKAAHISPPSGVADAVAAEIFNMLTVSAGLLLGRLGRALVHGAAVVGPSGRAVALIGDSRSGKSTTCANLLKAGWRYLSDDQIVIWVDGGRVLLEGWPRRFHLDEGWHRGVPTGTRGTVRSGSLGRNCRRRIVPLGGVALTNVSPNLPTAGSRCTSAQVFEQLVRQSPWFLTDLGGRAAVLQLFIEAARLPRCRLRLGADTFHAPSLVSQLFATLFEGQI
ncbi:hypothetical protein HRbin33_02029 [bacterium HR33]|nr:hypothetical protein HRbin33_02029 [bacterium HR33]